MESEFWGAVIPPAKTVKVEVDESGEFVLVTQVALGGDAKPGRCALAIRVGGEAEKVLCTLDKGKCDQVGLDVIVDATFELRNHGPCALHLSGLRQMDGIDEAAEEDEMERLAAMKALEDTDEDDDSGEEEEEEDSEGDSDDDSDDDSEPQKRSATTAKGAKPASSDSEDEASDEAADVLGELVEMFRAEHRRDPTEEELGRWAETLREAAEADGKLAENASDVLAQLVDMFKEKNGREPSEAEMAQWAATLKEAAAADDDADAEEEDEGSDDDSADDASEEGDLVFGAADLPKDEEEDFGDSDEEDSDLDDVDAGEGITIEKVTGASKASKPGAARKKKAAEEEEEASDDESESESESSDDSDSDSDSSDDDDSGDDSDASSSDSDADSDPRPESTKRPAPGSASAEAKRARPSPAPGSANKRAFDEYADELQAYLAEHPKTHMAALGGKVKRPKNMMMKVKEFLVAHKDRFKIEGDLVSNA